MIGQHTDRSRWDPRDYLPEICPGNKDFTADTENWSRVSCAWSSTMTSLGRPPRVGGEGVHRKRHATASGKMYAGNDRSLPKARGPSNCEPVPPWRAAQFAKQMGHVSRGMKMTSPTEDICKHGLRSIKLSRESRHGVGEGGKVEVS